MTVMALGNLIASVVDTMREADVDPAIVHRFLDQLERTNEATLWGRPAEIMTMLTCVLRRSVASND